MKKSLKKLLEVLSDGAKDISFKVHLWDGEVLCFGQENPAFTLKLKTEKAARRILTGGTLGFGEEYMAGNIDVDGDFKSLMRLGTQAEIDNLKLSLSTRLRLFWQYLKTRDTMTRTPKNISHHYDRGNDFYKLWLDESMTYSCAYFRSETDTLEQAQQQKYEHLCRKLQLQKGDTLVDIGCGWGGMLIYAAKNYQISGVGCTLSEPQVHLAQEKIKQAGLQDRLTILKEDYRQLKGTFDKFVSIGMFEHVGRKYIRLFMEKTRSLLNAGGIGVLHYIGKEKYSPGDPWTLKYIFPGGYIPILDEVIRAMGEAGLIPIDIENLRLHYARTLEEWSKRFEAQVENIRKMFDESFVRMWRMFLNGSEAGFRYGNTRLYQITFTHGLNNNLPLTREYLYENWGVAP